MLNRYKYPRTPHLSFSPGKTQDDISFGNIDWFSEKTVVVTEKLDGECTTIYPDGYCHARSMDSKHHPSRSWVKARAAEFAPLIPEGHRVCGEYLYAEHSIPYKSLDSYFYLFAVFCGEKCLSWAETVGLADIIGVPTVPVLYFGPWDEAAIKRCWIGKSKVGGDQEGYVVRCADAFTVEEFQRSVAKYVRKGHVTTTDHWLSQPIKPNGLRPALSTP